MNIIIVGANQVGQALAEALVQEGHNVTVIDTDRNLLDPLQNRLDIRTVFGLGAYPNILQQAGAEDTDMIIAVTNDDEMNIVACQVAYTLFRTPVKLARLRAQQYTQYKSLFEDDHIPIDHIISPEHIVTDYVSELIQNPGALQVLHFAEKKVQLASLMPKADNIMVGKRLSEIYDALPDVDMHIVALFRGDHIIHLNPETYVQAGDEVFFITSSRSMRRVMDTLLHGNGQYKRIIIAGGGHIGERLAMTLEDQFDIKVIEHNANRCQLIAESLHRTTVLMGDCADAELLRNENIEHTDVFCAVTNDDEANIMSAMQAKRLGVNKVMALINRTTYVDLIEGSSIDIAISPQLTTIGTILTHIRRGDIVQVHALRRGAAEAIEIVVHGDKNNSSVVGRKLKDIKLPTGTILGAIVREEEVLMRNEEDTIEAGDHIILFLSNKKYLRDVEQLFQVSVTFV